MLKFMTCIHFGTGEGHTTLLLVTNSTNPDAEFRSIFGSYYVPSMLDKDEFIYGYGDLVPDKVLELIKNEPNCFFSWNSALHLNYS